MSKDLLSAKVKNILKESKESELDEFIRTYQKVLLIHCRISRDADRNRKNNYNYDTSIHRSFFKYWSNKK